MAVAERRKGTLVAAAALAVFFALLLVLPVTSRVSDGPIPAMVDSFYRSGSLVFGGGHVVLPLLEAEVVPPGWVTKDEFIAGYGAAQAVPGPLFTFSSYLGTVMETTSPRWVGGRGRARGYISAVLPAGDRRAALLGAAARLPPGQAGAHGRERGGGGAAAGCALRPGVDGRDSRAGGLCTGGGCLRAAGLLEGAAVAGGAADRRWGCADRDALAPWGCGPRRLRGRRFESIRVVSRAFFRLLRAWVDAVQLWESICGEMGAAWIRLVRMAVEEGVQLGVRLAVAGLSRRWQIGDKPPWRGSAKRIAGSRR